MQPICSYFYSIYFGFMEPIDVFNHHMLPGRFTTVFLKHASASGRGLSSGVLSSPGSELLAEALLIAI